MQVLEFVFQSFWHFSGTVILLWILMCPVFALAGALKGRKQ